jgi:hypothetical protein
MTTTPLLKRILTTLCFSSIASFSFAQTVEKTVLVTYYDYPKLPTATSFSAIGIGPDKNIKIYGSQFIPGRIKNAAEKEKSFSMISGNDMRKGTNLFVERSLSPTLDSLGTQQTMIIEGEPGNQISKYEIAGVADFMDSGLPKEFDITYTATAFDKFPILNPDGQKRVQKLIGAVFKVEGKGIFGMKDPKSYPVFVYSQPLTKDVTSTGAITNSSVSGILKSATNPLSNSNNSNEDAPRKEQNMVALDGYIPAFEAKPILTSSDQKIFNGILGQKNEDDKWAHYKNIAFVTFDNKGNILQKDTVAFQYIRRTYHASVVQDFAGKEKGFVYFFGGLVTLGGKKEKDPMENNFQIVYLGLDGKIKFKHTFQRGIPTNKFGLSPVAVIEKDGKLIVWNVRTDKGLAESTPEILTFDEKGMTVKVEKADITKNADVSLNSYLDFSRIDEEPIKKMFDSGKVSLMKQLTDKKTRQVQTSVGSTVSQEYLEYGDVMLLTFEDNDKFPHANLVKMGSSSVKPIDNTIIEEDANGFTSIMTSENINMYVSFKGYKLTTTWVNAHVEKGTKMLIPEANVMKNNFVVDKENKKIYFVYRFLNPRYIKLMKFAY